MRRITVYFKPASPMNSFVEVLESIKKQPTVESIKIDIDEEIDMSSSSERQGKWE